MHYSKNMIAKGMRELRQRERAAMGDGALSWGGGGLGGSGTPTNPPAERDHLPDGWTPRELSQAEHATAAAGRKPDYWRALECTVTFGKRFRGRRLKNICLQPAGRNYLRWLYGQKKKKWPAEPGYFDRMLKIFVEESGIGEQISPQRTQGTQRTQRTAGTGEQHNATA